MRRHNHSPEQQQVLLADIQEVGKRLLGMQFNEPERDQLIIRQHAYLKGRFDTLTQLISDEYPDPVIQQPDGE